MGSSAAAEDQEIIAGSESGENNRRSWRARWGWGWAFAIVRVQVNENLSWDLASKAAKLVPTFAMYGFWCLPSRVRCPPPRFPGSRSVRFAGRTFPLAI